MQKRMRWERELELTDMPTFLELAKSVAVTSTQDFSLVLDRASGPFLWDCAGRRYFDFSSGVGTANVGYSHPSVCYAISRYARRGTIIGDNDWPNAVATLLKAKLCEITPGNFPKKVFLSNSGTEAVEAAIKLLISKRPDRTSFIAFRGAFHGRSGYSLALNGSKKIHRRHFPRALKVYHLPFPDAYDSRDSASLMRYWMEVHRCLRSEIPLEEVNGVFIEMVQGEGGINVADEGMLRLIEILRKEGVKIVVDEVQTGFYRTGKLFACEHYGLEPDILCLGKALGGGLPIGATVSRAELDFEEFGRHSNTFGGNTPVAAAALTVIEILQSLDLKELEERIRVLSEFAPEGLGLMRRRRFPSAAARNEYVKAAHGRNVILLGAGEQNVRFMPPVTTTKQELEDAIEILRSIEI
ncbi:MAG: aminotransferase class III-fold pyridoxal phosphate-dependent enzyme [Parcubacteria group bacterium]|nr:aminotransferase class III-fold pyridoxal phosphate-dependent enzyme [Parcubacteria group bacterium]